MKTYTFCNFFFKIRHYYRKNKTFLLTKFQEIVDNKDIYNHFQWIFIEFLYKNDTISYCIAKC